jgi:hypothetical protein
MLWTGALTIMFAGSVFAQDKSSHTAHYVTVDGNVKLEVLDWGGSGWPIVMLAGLGDTAHAFDDFAPNSLAHIACTASLDADSAHQAFRSRVIRPIGWVTMFWK